MTLLNQFNESLRLSRLPLYQNQEKITIISEEGGEFLVSKFIFNFLSSYSNPNADTIFAPVSTKSLSLICQALSFNQFEEISLEDLQLLGINSKNFVTGVAVKREDINSLVEVESKSTHSRICLFKNQLSKDVLVQRTQNKLQSKLLNVEKVADSLTTNDVRLSFLGSSIEDINNINEEESTNQDEQALNETEGLNDKIDSSKETDSSKTVVSLKNNKQKMKDCQKRAERGRKRFVGDPLLKKKIINGKEFLESVMCQICGKVFERTNFAREGRLNLIQRHFRHYANHKKQSKACECGVQFNSSAEKHRHFQNVHKSFIKCPKCPQFLANKENLEQHLKNKHTERECDICDFITEDRRELRRHKTIHDPKEQKEKKEVKAHVCTELECGKTFTDLDRLKKHQRKCIKVECHECHKRVSISFIKKHIANIHHNNQKKYCCQKCGKRFFEKYQMEQHEQVEHEGHRFKCRYPECNKSDQEYRDQSNRVTHERKKHGATYTKFLAAERTLPNSA